MGLCGKGQGPELGETNIYVQVSTDTRGGIVLKDVPVWIA